MDIIKTPIEQIQEALGEDPKIKKTPDQIEKEHQNTLNMARAIDALKNG